MSRLKQLFTKIENIESVPSDINLEYNGKTDDDSPYIYIDGFTVDEDDDDFFAVSDETGAIEDFAGTEQQVVDFFAGIYDAYVKDEKSSSSDFYAKGFDLTLSTAQDDEDGEED